MVLTKVTDNTQSLAVKSREFYGFHVHIRLCLFKYGVVRTDTLLIIEREIYIFGGTHEGD